MKPSVVALDVVETVFSLDRLTERFKQVGLAQADLPLFFAQMLRDAFALEASAVYKPFREVASANLAVAMATRGIEADQGMIETVIKGFGELSAHPDVRPAIEQLRDAGIRVIALSNGAAETTHKLLAQSDLSELVEVVVSVDEVRHWKPNREVYLHACRRAGVTLDRAILVAAHAWDVQGAKQAGMRAGWVRRKDKSFHAAMSQPDFQGNSLVEVANAILAVG